MKEISFRSLGDYEEKMEVAVSDTAVELIEVLHGVDYDTSLHASRVRCGTCPHCGKELSVTISLQPVENRIDYGGERQRTYLCPSCGKYVSVAKQLLLNRQESCKYCGRKIPAHTQYCCHCGNNHKQQPWTVNEKYDSSKFWDQVLRKVYYYFATEGIYLSVNYIDSDPEAKNGFWQYLKGRKK